MGNRCRYHDCNDSIPDGHLMCKWHWLGITVENRDRLFAEFRRDPESQAYHEALHDACNDVQSYLDQRATGWR